MSKIIFLNSPQIYNGEFSQIGSHQVRLVFESELPSAAALLSGFYLINEHNGFIQTKREDYRYIYRMYEEDPSTIELCNDNISYEEIKSELLTDSISKTAAYEEILEDKIKELSSSCKSVIEAGLSIHGLHYSFSLEDQINLKEIFDIVKATGSSFIYHADGEKSSEYSAKELIEIYCELIVHKYRQVIYFNLSREYLKSLDKTDENKELISSYHYGIPLTDSYLKIYDTLSTLAETYNESFFNISN